MLNEKHLGELEDWGFNLVRLGSMWSGMEPEEGAYDQGYIDILEVSNNIALVYKIYRR